MGALSRIPGRVDLGSLVTAGEPDTVFHCAGGASVRFALEDPHEDFERSVSSTAALLEWARSARHAPSVVLVSSAGVYGDTGPRPVREERAAQPESIYATHKLMAEELCRLQARSFGLRCAIVRLFSVYGPLLRKQLLWDGCNKLSRGETGFGGTGREARDWVHVRDAAALLEVAAAHAATDCPVVNGGTGEAATVDEVVGLIARRLGAAAPVFNGQVRAAVAGGSV